MPKVMRSPKSREIDNKENLFYTPKTGNQMVRWQPVTEKSHKVMTRDDFDHEPRRQTYAPGDSDMIFSYTPQRVRDLQRKTSSGSSSANISPLDTSIDRPRFSRRSADYLRTELRTNLLKVNKMKEEYQERERQLLDEVKALKEKLYEEQTKVHNVRSVAAENVSQLNLAEDEITKLKRVVDDLQSELAAIKATNYANEMELNKLLQAQGNWFEDLRVEKSRGEELQRKLFESFQTNETLENTLSDLNAEKHQLWLTIEKLARGKDEAEDAWKHYKELYTVCQREKNEEKTKLELDLTAQIEEVQEKLDRCIAELELARANEHSAEERASIAQKEVDRCIAELELARANGHSAEERASIAQKETLACEQSLRERNDQLHNLVINMGEKGETIQKHIEEIGIAEEKIRILTNDCEKLLEQNRRDREAYSKDNEALRQVIDAERSKNAEHVKALNRELRHYRDKKEEAEQRDAFTAKHLIEPWWYQTRSGVVASTRLLQDVLTSSSHVMPHVLADDGRCLFMLSHNMIGGGTAEATVEENSNTFKHILAVDYNALLPSPSNARQVFEDSGVNVGAPIEASENCAISIRLNSECDANGTTLHSTSHNQSSSIDDLPQLCTPASDKLQPISPSDSRVLIKSPTLIVKKRRSIVEKLIPRSIRTGEMEKIAMEKQKKLQKINEVSSTTSSRTSTPQSLKSVKSGKSVKSTSFKLPAIMKKRTAKDKNNGLMDS